MQKDRASPPSVPPRYLKFTKEIKNRYGIRYDRPLHTVPYNEKKPPWTVQKVLAQGASTSKIDGQANQEAGQYPAAFLFSKASIPFCGNTFCKKNPT